MRRRRGQRKADRERIGEKGMRHSGTAVRKRKNETEVESKAQPTAAADVCVQLERKGHDIRSPWYESVEFQVQMFSQRSLNYPPALKHGTVHLVTGRQ
jgi:hypothetical protein